MWTIIAYIVIAILSFVGMVLGIWRIVLYFKFSWARRENKNNYTGVDVAEKIFDKFQDKIKVKTSFWSITYVYYQKRKKTLRLGRIDSRRKSIWTMATSGRQAYAAHILEQGNSNNEKPRVGKIWIKLQTFWVNQFIGFGMFILTIALTILTAYFIVDENITLATISFFFIFLSTAFVGLIYSIASFKTSKMLIEDADLIFGGIIPKEEIDQIKQLWKISYIIAIFDLIESIIWILLILFKMIFIIYKEKQIEDMF